MNWRNALSQHLLRDCVTVLLLLGCLAAVTAGKKRNRGRDWMSGHHPQTEADCENTNAAEICIEEQHQANRENPINFCHDLVNGRVERKMRNCLEGLLQQCSEDVQNRQHDVLRNGAGDMQDMCYEPEDIDNEEDSECGLAEIASCLKPLLGAANITEDQMPAMTLLTNPSGVAHNQEHFCSTLPRVNKEDISTCLAEVDRKCTAQTGRSQNGYNITQTFQIIQQICEPGCENFNKRTNDAEMCMQQMDENVPSCEQIHQAVTCLAEHILCCGMLERQYKEQLQQSNLLSQCPSLKVNMSCQPSANKYEDKPEATHSGNCGSSWSLHGVQSPAVIEVAALAAVFWHRQYFCTGFAHWR